MKRKILILGFLTSFIYGINDIDFNNVDTEKRTDKGDFHIRAGYAYSSWNTGEMENFKMDNQGLNLVWGEFIFKDYYSPIFYPQFLLHVEHSFNNSPTPSEIFNEKKSIDLDDAYLKVLGTLRFDNGIFLSYNYEKFSSVIDSINDNNYIIDDVGFLNPFPIQHTLVSETIFRDYSIGYKYQEMDIYIFYSEYQKPYTINQYSQESSELSNLLLYPQLTSYGIGFKWYITHNNFYIIPELKMGIGKLELTNDINYDEFVGIDSVIYTGGKIKIGYTGDITNTLNYHLMYLGEFRLFSEGDNQSENSDINEDITNKILISLQYSF